MWPSARKASLRENGYMYTYGWVPLLSPETITTLLIIYPPLQNKKLKINFKNIKYIQVFKKKSTKYILLWLWRSEVRSGSHRAKIKGWFILEMPGKNLFICCYGLNACVPPKFICWNQSPVWQLFGGRALEVISLCGWSPHEWDQWPYKRDHRELSSSFCQLRTSESPPSAA